MKEPKYVLTKEVIEKCRDYFERDTKIREMDAEAQLLQMRGDYIGAMELRKKKESLFKALLANYQQEIESQVDRVTLRSAGIPQDDLQEIERYLVTLYMAIDIMDGCVMDINSILHRTDDTLSFDEVKDYAEMAHMAREQLARFASVHEYRKYMFWGDITDKMYENMQNKAKSIIRKTNTEEAKLKRKSKK